MQALQKLVSMLMVASLMAFTGVTVAASDVTGIDSGSPQQSPTPPDCKKTPSDPRCKK